MTPTTTAPATIRKPAPSPTPAPGASATVELFARWQAGDRGAFDELLERDLPRLGRQVRRRLGPRLRSRAETGDFLQDALVDVLRYAPRARIENVQRFRALLTRIVENNLRDQSDWYGAERRDVARELQAPNPQEAVEGVWATAADASPGCEVERRELRDQVRRALGRLSPMERRAIELRHWERLSFDELGARLGISDEAARKRFRRALDRLVDHVEHLRGDRHGGG